MPMKTPSHFSPTPGVPPFVQPTAQQGFTRVDLLAVLAAGGLLGSLFVSAVAGAGNGSSGAGCLNNLRQLTRALLQFAEDHDGWFPKNPDDGGLYNWVAGAAGVGGAAEFNPDLAGDPAHSALAPYLEMRAQVFRCPADARAGLYQGANAALQGQAVPAARSYSMNCAVGTQGGGTARVGTAPVDGAWLDGYHANTHNRPWRTYGLPGHIVAPAPAGLFVFIDEQPLSLNDGNFAVSMRDGANARWVDWPGTQHEFGAGLGFADGHAELHAWEDERTLVRGNLLGPSSVPHSPDLTWLQTRTSARAQ